MSKIKVLMTPTVEQIGTDNGVGQVLLNYQRHFSDADMELVHATATSYDVTASHLGFDINALVHHNHGLWLGGLDSDRAEQNKLIVEHVRRAKEVVVPSEYVALYFRRDMRIDPNVIGHGVNLDEWQGAEPRGYVLWDKNRRSNICDPAPVTVLARQFPNTPFVTTFANERAPNVHEIGRVPFETIRRVFLGASVYLATTKETFGISILQALACGVPVVGYNYGGASDIVRNGIDGLLVTPGDTNALADALNEVLKNRNSLSDNAKERAQDFSWQNVVQRLRSVYERAMQPDEPTVSVVIPCYNYADVLPRAVESVANQTYPVKEIVIVNDGSPDNTDAVARQLAERYNNVVYVEQENGGVAKARNNGILHTTSKYVSCLDADDEMKPQFLNTVVNAMEQDHSVHLGYTKLELAFQNGDRSVGGFPDVFDADKQCAGKNQVPTCCVFRKRDWLRLGGYKPRFCPRGFGAEDAEFWLRFTKHGLRPKLISDEAMFTYHLGGNTQRGEYEEPAYFDWHTDLKTGWYPFAALCGDGIHAVTDYADPVYSIIIPVGPGHEGYLEDALDSVEAQSDKRWECIVVWNMDNGVMFDNDTIDRIHFAYPFVKFVVANQKYGAGYARNVGVKHSRGKYLVFLDADDYLQPQFLEFTRKFLEHYDLYWVYTDLYTQADKLEYFETFEWDTDRLWRSGIMAVTCLYKREHYDAVGGFDEENNREDWDFHLRLANAGFCGTRLGLPLFTYRQRLGYRREYRKVATTADESAALKKIDVERLHNSFDKEKLRMACGSCRKVEIEPVSHDDRITMNYTGHVPNVLKTDITFKGPVTGETYRSERGRMIGVHPQDADAFEENGLFQRVRKVKMGTPIVAPNPKRGTVKKTRAENPKEQVVTREETVTETKERSLDIAKNAAEEARAETERYMKELFGRNHLQPKEEPEVEPDPPLPENWWLEPGQYSVPKCKRRIEAEGLSREKIANMLRSELRGKGRVTLTRYLKSRLQ